MGELNEELQPVRIEHVDGHWVVFVVEDGQTFQHNFEAREFADNFAAGQRLRLMQKRGVHRA